MLGVSWGKLDAHFGWCGAIWKQVLVEICHLWEVRVCMLCVFGLYDGLCMCCCVILMCVFGV